MSACHTYIFVLVSIKRLIFRRSKKTTTWMSLFMRNDFIFISSITILHYRISIYFGCHKICKIGKMSSIFNLRQLNIFCDLKKIAKKVKIRSSRKLPYIWYVWHTLQKCFVILCPISIHLYISTQAKCALCCTT